MINLVLIVLLLVGFYSLIIVLFYKVIKPDSTELVVFIPIFIVTTVVLFGLLYNTVVLCENSLVERIEQGTYNISSGVKIIGEDTIVMYKIEGYER